MAIEESPIVQFRRLQSQLPKGAITAGVAIVVLLLVGSSALYQVQPEEVAVVLRFGAFVRTTTPGLRVKLPLVEQVLKVPVQRQLKQEFGFRTVAAGVRTQFTSPGQFQEEAVMLTGDLNVALVEWIVQYGWPVHRTFSSMSAISIRRFTR